MVWLAFRLRPSTPTSVRARSLIPIQLAVWPQTSLAITTWSAPDRMKDGQPTALSASGWPTPSAKKEVKISGLLPCLACQTHPRQPLPRPRQLLLHLAVSAAAPASVQGCSVPSRYGGRQRISARPEGVVGALWFHVTGRLQESAFTPDVFLLLHSFQSDMSSAALQSARAALSSHQPCLNYCGVDDQGELLDA